LEFLPEALSEKHLFSKRTHFYSGEAKKTNPNEPKKSVDDFLPNPASIQARFISVIQSNPIKSKMKNKTIQAPASFNIGRWAFNVGS